MDWLSALLGTIIYILNHKKNSLKRLPILIIIALIIILILFVFESLSLNYMFWIITISTAIDNLIYIYQKKYKEKNNKN